MHTSTGKAGARKSITEQDVAYLSQLIRIEVKPAEVGRLKDDLTKILNFISQLEQVDVTGVEPLLSPLVGECTERVATPLQADEPQPSQLTAAAIEGNAPEFGLGHFVVPRVMDEA